MTTNSIRISGVQTSGIKTHAVTTDVVEINANETSDIKQSGLSLESLQSLQTETKNGGLFAEPGEFANFKLALQDDSHEYLLKVSDGIIQRISVDTPHLANPVDITITASNSAWSEYLTETPSPAYADLLAMFTEKHASMTGNAELFWQNVTYIYGMMRHLGHRKPLLLSNGAKPEPLQPHGSIEEVTGKYLHLHLDNHDYRIFFEESGPKDGIPIVLLHAANSDARMWRHQLADNDLTGRFRLIAFDMPWRGRSVPPQELLRTEYKLTNDFYRRLIREFCDALQLDKPLLVGCSMGGYIMFYCAYHDPGRYRALVAVAARDFEPRRWAMEKIFRHPAVSFNRVLACTSNGFMAPQDPVGCTDETAWLYETGSPRALRGDLNFASRDCDARPFMGKIDTETTPFYVLGGDYDWSCTEEHTDAIKERMPGANVVRMKGIGHFPPDENPETFKQYLLPVLEDALEKTK